MVFVWPTSHVGMLHPASLEPDAQKRASDFLQFARASLAGTTYKDAKALLSCSKNQAETRKSLFEEMGLMYVPYRSDQILLTPVGRQLLDLIEIDPSMPIEGSTAPRIDAVLIWALIHSQINRPQSFGSPRLTTAEREDCDLRPYAAGWKLVIRLGGHLALQELVGKVRRLQHVEEFDLFAQDILAARQSGTHFISRSELFGESLLNVRIYWKSHFSGAFRFLRYDSDTEIFSFQPGVQEIIETALNFEAGCGASSVVPIRAREWTSTEDYFERIAGRPCPQFLASGNATVVEFEGENLVILKGYKIDIYPGSVVFRGGPELCTLPLKSACFHDEYPSRLLRIDGKSELATGEIEIHCGLGRPITNLTLLESLS
jgi:hypothetical protein